jgi:hypothetical protein
MSSFASEDQSHKTTDPYLMAEIADTMTHDHKDFFQKILGYPTAGLQGEELAARNAAADPHFAWLEDYLLRGGHENTTYTHLQGLMNVAANIHPTVASQARTPPEAPPSRPGNYFIVSEHQKFTEKVMNRTPDLCMIYADLDHPDDIPSYVDIRIPFEVKPSTVRVEQQLAHQVRATFAAQCDRRFVLCVSITYPNFRVWHWDRCGAIASGDFHIIEERERFVWLVDRLSETSPLELGFDPTFVSKGPILGSGSHTKFSTTIKNGQEGPVELDVLELLWSAKTVVGRSTRCYKVVDSKGTQYILKESWQTHPREHRFYQRIKECKITQGVAQCSAYEQSAKVSDMRKGVGVGPLAIKEDGTEVVFEDRVCCRLLVSTIGMSLDKFRTLRELFGAVRDCVEGSSPFFLIPESLRLLTPIMRYDSASDFDRMR